MKCPHCGADNPEYSFFCGRCAGELRRGSEGGSEVTAPRPSASLEKMLRPHLPRIRENALRKQKGLFTVRHWTGSIVFRCGDEVLTLEIEKDGQVSLLSGSSEKPSIVLTGQPEDFERMFSAPDKLTEIPSSVDIHIGGLKRDDPMFTRLASDATWKILRKLLE